MELRGSALASFGDLPQDQGCYGTLFSFPSTLLAQDCVNSPQSPLWLLPEIRHASRHPRDRS